MVLSRYVFSSRERWSSAVNRLKFRYIVEFPTGALQARVIVTCDVEAR